MLVLGTLSILELAWGNDIRQWTPELTFSIAYAECREQAFRAETDIVIMNHDGVVWLANNKHFLGGFDEVVIDECTAFSGYNSERTQALIELRSHFEFRRALSGTLGSNSILGYWGPAFIIDDGERLGRSFSLYRKQVCDAHPIPGVAFGATYTAKQGAEAAVADRLRDITMRFRLEDCVDIPPNRSRYIPTLLSASLMSKYTKMKRTSILEEGDLTIEAINAGSRWSKCLQLCTGALYDNEKLVKSFSSERYNLISDLVKERAQCLVAFNWQHQRAGLEKILSKSKISYAVIDGSVNAEDRIKAANQFQSGHIQVVLAHPQAAGHGITLTKGTTTIWSSPTPNAEWFKQFNHRIYRAGQNQQTETLLVYAEGTLEKEVYGLLDKKLESMDKALTYFETQTKMRA